MASECSHTDRVMYAKGICRNCYLSQYHKARRKAKKGTQGALSNTNFAGLQQDEVRARVLSESFEELISTIP